MDVLQTYMDRRDKMIETQNLADESNKELVERYVELTRELDETTSDLARERKSWRALQKEAEGRDRDAEELRRRMARNAFVLVLIDGDNMLFKDDLVIDLASGGQEAAGLLRQAIETAVHAHDAPSLPSEYKIIVRVYVNMIGLSITYGRAGLLGCPGKFEDFVRGFNKTYPLFEFVDAGNEKECADVKIREMLEINVHNIHCRHIFFGGSGDNGYVRQLTPYAMDENVRERITLLEGPKFGRGFHNLSLRKVQFDTVFRNQTLEVNAPKLSPSMFMTTPPLHQGVDASATLVEIGRNKSASYATTAASGGSFPPNPPSPPTQQSFPTAQVYRNAVGQRIDPPLKPSNASFLDIKSFKCCNQFYLNDVCPCGGPPKCRYEHRRTLKTDERNALRHIARQTRCYQGTDCNDPRCLSGHMCAARSCTWGTECKFLESEHVADRTIIDKKFVV